MLLARQEIKHFGEEKTIIQQQMLEPPKTESVGPGRGPGPPKTLRCYRCPHGAQRKAETEMHTAGYGNGIEWGTKQWKQSIFKSLSGVYKVSRIW